MTFEEAVNIYLNKSVNSKIMVYRIQHWDESKSLKELSIKLNTPCNLLFAISSKYGLKYRKLIKTQTRKEVIKDEERT